MMKNRAESSVENSFEKLFRGNNEINEILKLKAKMENDLKNVLNTRHRGTENSVKLDKNEWVDKDITVIFEKGKGNNLILSLEFESCKGEKKRQVELQYQKITIHNNKLVVEDISKKMTFTFADAGRVTQLNIWAKHNGFQNLISSGL